MRPAIWENRIYFAHIHGRDKKITVNASQHNLILTLHGHHGQPCAHTNQPKGHPTMATQQSQLYKQLRAQNNQGWMQGEDHRAVYAVELIPACEVRTGDILAAFDCGLASEYGIFTHWHTVGAVQMQHLQTVERTSGTKYVVRCRMTNNGRNMLVKEKPTNARYTPATITHA